MKSITAILFVCLLAVTAANVASAHDDITSKGDCAFCEWLVSEIESFIAQNQTEDEIVKLLNKVCGILPGALGETCKDYVDEYAVALIQLLLNKEDPDTVCTQVKLCDQSEAPKVSDVQCKDGSSCPDGSTCCALNSGGYGCCPYADATCCSDGQHCCPNGYTCDLSKGQCVKQQRGAPAPQFLARPMQSFARVSAASVRVN
jgi:hypothetical protein